MHQSVPASVVFLLASLAHAGPVLDELVTPMHLDQRSGPPNLQVWRDIQPNQPLGQTFVTGPRAHRLCRIAIRYAWWNPAWTDGESLTLTLWDSPSKQTRLAQSTIPWKWRRWEGGILMFPLWTDVQPNRSYYFELTVSGGDGHISGINLTTAAYPSGQAHVAGSATTDADLFFETHTKDHLNPDADYGCLFALWNLDHPGLERVRQLVSEKKWEAASYALVDYYEQRRPDLLNKEPFPTTRPTDLDLREADLALQMKVLADEEGVADIGPDWNHYAIWPTRGGVGLTRGGIRKFIATGYRLTRDPKYAKAWNDVNYFCLRDQPNPVEAGALPREGQVKCALDAGIEGGTMWSALSIGARSSFGLVYYRWFVDAPEFTKDVRAGFIFNLADMGYVLARMKGGGNWETQMNSALMQLAEQHPEYREGPDWMRQGLATMIRNLLETVHPDGPLKEATFNYHMLTLNRYTKMLQTVDQMQMAIPGQARERVLRAAEYPAYGVLPDFTLPLWGDSNPTSKPGDILERAADYFGRDDLRWVATEGKSGRPPTVTSIAFPHAGYFFMRSGWTPDARYLALHNGHSTSHGHNDALGIVLAAYGRQLIVDPGIYIYGTPHAARLTRTASHSTVCIDDRDLNNANGANAWASSSVWDCFDGTSAGYKGLAAKHRRRIVFVKPDYWVICDDVSGTGTHDVKGRFVLADPSAEVDAGKVYTQHPTAGNLAILPAQPETAVKVATMQRAGSWNSLLDSVVVEHTPGPTLPAQWTTVLYPYAGKNRPSVKITALPAAAGRAFNVERSAIADTFVFQRDDRAIWTAPSIAFVGDTLYLRSVEGKPVALAAHTARRIVVDGQEVFRSTAGADVSLRWTSQGLEVEAGPWAEVKAPASGTLIINGEKVETTGWVRTR